MLPKQYDHEGDYIYNIHGGSMTDREKKQREILNEFHKDIVTIWETGDQHEQTYQKRIDNILVQALSELSKLDELEVGKMEKIITKFPRKDGICGVRIDSKDLAQAICQAHKDGKLRK